MSLTTQFTALRSAITGISGSPAYREIPNLLNVDETGTSHHHKVFSLRTFAIDIQKLISSSEITSNGIIVNVEYRIDKDNTYESNYDLFVTLQDTLQALGDYLGTVSFSYDRGKDNKHCAGEVRFHYGYRTT